MAKVKITIEGNVQDFTTAANVADIVVEEKLTYGSVNVCICNYKHPSQLYRLGLLQTAVSLQTESTNKPVTETTKNLEGKK
jgi:hypothetical protein